MKLKRKCKNTVLALSVIAPIGLFILTEKISTNQCFCIEYLKETTENSRECLGTTPPFLSNTPNPIPLIEKQRMTFPSLLWSELGVAKEQIFWPFTVSVLHATLGKNKLSKAHQFYSQINETLMGKGPLGQWFSSSFLLKLPFCPINVPSSLRKILGLP